MNRYLRIGSEANPRLEARASTCIFHSTHLPNDLMNRRGHSIQETAYCKQIYLASKVVSDSNCSAYCSWTLPLSGELATIFVQDLILSSSKEDSE
jgi:hypothetical protein